MGSNPEYICHFYDIMTNLAAYSNNARLVINRGLTAGEDKHGDFGVIGSGDYSLLGSAYSKHMVKNLCTSQK